MDEKTGVASCAEKGREVSQAPLVRAVGTAVPDIRWAQEKVYEFLSDQIPFYRRKVVERIFRSAGIKARHFAFVPDGLTPPPGVDALHTAFETHAPALGIRAAQAALGDGGLEAQSIDGIVVATSTGYLCPGLAARIAPALGLRADVMRHEMVGAGCAGAIPALRSGHDFVMANPGARVLVICVELCSTCLFIDEDIETVVGNAICADGAAAVVLDGAERASAAAAAPEMPRLTHFATAAKPEALDLVGFAQPERFLRIILSEAVPDNAADLIRRAAEQSLRLAQRQGRKFDFHVVHPGGRKVLDRLGKDLNLSANALAVSRQVLSDYGNMSSPTVLFVLAQTIRQKRPGPGQIGLIGALGPGMVAETALLLW